MEWSVRPASLTPKMKMETPSPERQWHRDAAGAAPHQKLRLFRPEPVRPGPMLERTPAAAPPFSEMLSAGGGIPRETLEPPPVLGIGDRFDSAQVVLPIVPKSSRHEAKCSAQRFPGALVNP